MKDLLGKAMLDFQKGNTSATVVTETNISEEDEMEIGYFFRGFDEMPRIEQKALQLCKGKILDVGCGAGSHSLYLQKKGFDVTPIDISENAIKTCHLRGLENARVQDLLSLENERFDTILLLMNGTGIFQKLEFLDVYFKKLSSLLNDNGQILIDSSDILYMYDENDDGSFTIPADNYYGELEFIVHYKNETEEPFPWLYLDYNTLQRAAIFNGFECELIAEGEHYDYLAKLYK